MNSIFIIQPYKQNGIWAFDDPVVGLVREPFVGNINLMIDRLTIYINNAKDGFNLLFSAEPFVGWEIELHLSCEEYFGNWYFCPKYNLEGWLCPALFKYFSKAPKKLFASTKGIC